MLWGDFEVIDCRVTLEENVNAGDFTHGFDRANYKYLY